MSQKQRPITKVKKNDKKDDKRENVVEEPIDEDAQPWKNIFRPTCAQPPKDNSFTLDDEVTSAAVESALSSFTVSDPNEEGNPLCYVSPGFLSLTGYSEQECLGRNCKFLQAGKLEPATHETLRASLSERRFTTVELTNCRKDGRPFQNLLSLMPVLGGDGTTLLHFVGVQCDLDERRRRGEVVDDSFLAKWQEQIKHCLTAFALVDVSGGATASGTGTGGGGGPSSSPAYASRSSAGAGTGSAAASPPASAPSAAAVCAVSPGFSSMTGYSQSDVMGWNLLCLCGPETSERDMRKLITSQWAHTPTVVKLLCYKRDGTPFWALILSYPITSTPASPPPGAAAPGAGSGAVLPGSGSRAVAGNLGISAAARQGQGQGAQGRAGGLGLGFGGLLAGVASGGGAVGVLSGLAAAAAPAVGGSVSTPVVKYCLCCVVDITLQRLKKVVGGKYVLGKAIGAGAFGLVRIGKNVATDELVAVKGVDATRFRSIAEIEQIQEEMSVLSSLKHPNIIRLYDVHFQSNTFFLVMEFAGGGSLVQFTRSHGDTVRHCLDESTAGRVFVQMVSALDYCHRRRVVHRDLKPENILMDEHNNLKIADFGLAAVAAPFSGGLTLQCGTPEFTAPEITVGREYDGPSVDIWSMGVILYEALCGNLPFKGPNQAALFKAIQRGVFDPLPAHISADCKDLVRRMMVVDASSRINMDEILRHPWVIKANASAASAARLSGSAKSSSTANGTLGGSDPLRTSGGGNAAGSGTPSSLFQTGSSGDGGDDSRPGSAAWRGASGTGPGSGSRGGGLSRISDSAGQQAGFPAGPHSSSSRPTSASPTGAMGQGQGPQSPAGSQAPPPGGLHDSVKLVIPSQSSDRDDPVLAAILRSHAHVGGDAALQSQSSSRNGVDDGEDGDLHVQHSSQSYTMGGASTGAGTPGGGRRDPTPASASSSRVAASSRSMGGVSTAGAGNLHGQNQGNGKARGGALLPTLGGGAGASGNSNLNGVMDRRLQDPTRFRSPARNGQGGASGPGVRGGGASGARGQQASQQSGPPASPSLSPHGGHAYVPTDGIGRQLPPIQASRAPGKKSSWMPGA